MAHISGAGSAGNAVANNQNLQDANQVVPEIGGQAFQDGNNTAPPAAQNVEPFEFMGTGEQFDASEQAAFSNSNNLGRTPVDQRRGAQPLIISSFDRMTPGAQLDPAQQDGSANSNRLSQASPMPERDADAVPPGLTRRVPEGADTASTETRPTEAGPGRQMLERGAGTATGVLQEMPLPSALDNQSNIPEMQRGSFSSLLVQDEFSDAGDSDYEQPELRRDSATSMDRFDRRAVRFDRSDSGLVDLAAAFADGTEGRILSTGSDATVASRDTQLWPSGPVTGNETPEDAGDIGLDHIRNEVTPHQPEIGFDTQENQLARNKEEGREANEALQYKLVQASGPSIFGQLGSLLGSLLGGVGDFFAGLFRRNG